MATLSVLKFPTVEGAQKVESTLLAMQRQQLIDVQEAAILSWAPGAKYPETRYLHSLVDQSTLINAFWDKLLGLIFSLPYLGHTWGMVADEPNGQFNDFGMGDEFIKETREKVTEGTSALFLLTKNSVMEKIVNALYGQTFEIILINLPNAQVDELWAASGAA